MKTYIIDYIVGNTYKTKRIKIATSKAIKARTARRGTK